MLDWLFYRLCAEAQASRTPSKRLLAGQIDRIVKAFKGCSKDCDACFGSAFAAWKSISSYERSMGRPLPFALKYFSWREPSFRGRLWPGRVWGAAQLSRNAAVAAEILRESAPSIPLPVNYVPFMEHSGGMFWCIDASSGDDGTVIFFKERAAKFEQISDSFTLFLETEVRESMNLAPLHRIP
jgi:hypothetical protein